MAQQINDNFSLLAGLPIDNRNKKTTIAERDAISPTRRFQGLMCFVDQTQTLYMLIGGILNSNWTGIAGNNLSNGLETIIEGFYVLLAGKTTPLDWEVGDKFRGWIGDRYVVGTILTLPVSLPSDIDDPLKVELAIDSDNINEVSTDEVINNSGVTGTTATDALNTLNTNVNDLNNSIVWNKNGNDIYNNNIGKVGIGLASPQANLDVIGSTRSSGEITSNTGLSVGPQNYQVTYTSPNLTDTEQGYTTDGNFHYMSGTNIMKKLDSSWSTVLTNTTPLSGIPVVNHLGDIVYLNGFIYAPVEYNTGGVYTDMKIAKYNATTLALVATYDISAQGHEASSVTTDGTNLYIISFYDGTKIWKYDLVGNYLGAITIASPFTNSIQGVSYYNNEFYIVEQVNFSKLSFDGTTKTFLRTLPGDVLNTHRGEGVQVVNGEVRILIAGVGFSTLNMYYLNPQLSVNKLFNANSAGEVKATKATIASTTTTDYPSVLSGTMVFGNRAAGIAPAIITRTPFGTNTGFLNVAIQNTDLARTGDSDFVFRTGWDSSGTLLALTTSGSAFSIQNGSTMVVNVLRSGATTFAGALNMPGFTLSAIPVTSTAPFDILTRNQSTSVLEKIQSTSILLTTTDQSWTGIKSSTNSSGTRNGGLTLNNTSGTGGAAALVINETGGANGVGILGSATVAGGRVISLSASNGGFGIVSGTSGATGSAGSFSTSGAANGIDVSGTSTGPAAQIQSTGSGINVRATIAGSGDNIWLDAGPSATGFSIRSKNNGTDTFTVNKTGNIVNSGSLNSGGIISTNTSFEMPNNGRLSCDGDGTDYWQGIRGDKWTTDIKVEAVGFIATNGTVRLKSYTVATLPAGVQGDTAYVTDATAPTYLGTLTGGGSIKSPVFYNGTAWVSF